MLVSAIHQHESAIGIKEVISIVTTKDLHVLQAACSQNNQMFACCFLGMQSQLHLVGPMLVDTG